MAPANKNRPGPSKTKPSKNSKNSKKEHQPEDQTDHDLPLQQKCLNLFRDAFNPSNEDAVLIQEVKTHLYNRQFATAFSTRDYMRVYAARWSPSRALAYLQILTISQKYLMAGNINQRYSVVSLGGGAGAELAAFAAWYATTLDTSPFEVLDITTVDVADWSFAAESLAKEITSLPVLSNHASLAAKDANKCLLEASRFKSTFLRQDVLNWSGSEMTQTLGNVNLITLMFTLNELYTESLPKTQALLSRITQSTSPGVLLLVIDSPGSYSTVSLNGAQKKYPMQWLLDFTLLQESPLMIETCCLWEKLESDDSRWFRLPPGLRYPIDLENMRYQMHLYRRLES